MFRSRFWMLVVVIGLMLGPLLATVGYGLYLRSGLYADSVARRVSAFLGAPVQIGSAFPLDATSQGFRDVVVWLPGEFYPIFYCDQATLRLTGDRTLELELRDGQILAETDTWNQATIAALLRTAFAHNFQRVRMASVKLVGMDIALRRGPVALRARNATGRIDLSDKAGRIDILCESLNDRKADEPIAIRCRFQPGTTPLIEELSLSVQCLPIEAFLNGRQGDKEKGRQGATATTTDAGTRGRGDAEKRQTGSNGRGAEGETTRGKETAEGERTRQGATTAAASQPSGGWFSGTITYRQKDRSSAAGQIELAGDLDRLDLGILANRPGRNGLGGIVSGTVSKAIFDAGRLGSAQCRLHLEDIRLAGLLASASCPKTSGLLTLDVHELQYEEGQVKAMLAAGQVRDLDLAPILQPWCGGTITGRFTANIEKVKIIDNRLDEIAGLVRMVPVADTPGTIDRAVLEAAVRQFLNIELPPVLPDTIGYTDLGARLHGADNELYIEGIAGPDEKYILVADFPPMPLPLIAQPTEPMALVPLQTLLAEKLKSLQTSLLAWTNEKIVSPK